MPRVTAAHEQAVRQRIVDAAIRVFGEMGYQRATVQDVVRASGLSVGAVYTHFKNKEELFLVACACEVEPQKADLRLRLAELGSVTDRLRTAIDFAVDSAVPTSTSGASGPMPGSWPRNCRSCARSCATAGRRWSRSPGWSCRRPSFVASCRPGSTPTPRLGLRDPHRRLRRTGARGRLARGEGCPPGGLRPAGAASRGPSGNAGPWPAETGGPGVTETPTSRPGARRLGHETDRIAAPGSGCLERFGAPNA